MRETEFADWYAALWPRVYRTVALTIGDRDLAEEAVAESFARALAGWPAAAEADNPAAWLHRVAVNEVRSRWRRGRLERRTVQRLAARQAQVDAPDAPDDALWTAVAALPPRMRHMVALRYVLDLPEAEIAAELHVSRGTVAATLSKARKTLAHTLDTTYSAASPAGREER
ncbi:sigma-70 family RNA polymerase sigma factor [Streptomyces sp. MP131-18]|uniref:RNA polymerase sigma factor n=1 Tax=Streptomyces sp. MP131-18 TaxID=1857892 RepID=UPI00097CA069|nr:sigma-70 family RNA polymerase sigma factor [Streptomyces sp. MP131-18]ONK10663.1 RNA polymerase sigma factor [Streptomyces sp. MP131-18]